MDRSAGHRRLACQDRNGQLLARPTLDGLIGGKAPVARRIVKPHLRPEHGGLDDAPHVGEQTAREQLTTVMRHLNVVGPHRAQPSGRDLERLGHFESAPRLTVAAAQHHSNRGRIVQLLPWNQDLHLRQLGNVPAHGLLRRVHERAAVRAIDPEIQVRSLFEDVAKVGELADDAESALRVGGRRAKQIVEKDILVERLDEQSGQRNPRLSFPDDASNGEDDHERTSC